MRDKGGGDRFVAIHRHDHRIGAEEKAEKGRPEDQKVGAASSLERSVV